MQSRLPSLLQAVHGGGPRQRYARPKGCTPCRGPAALPRGPPAPLPGSLQLRGMSCLAGAGTLPALLARGASAPGGCPATAHWPAGGCWLAAPIGRTRCLVSWQCFPLVISLGLLSRCGLRCTSASVIMHRHKVMLYSCPWSRLLWLLRVRVSTVFISTQVQSG